jgi:hypothetical protein
MLASLCVFSFELHLLTLGWFPTDGDPRGGYACRVGTQEETSEVKCGLYSVGSLNFITVQIQRICRWRRCLDDIELPPYLVSLGHADLTMTIPSADHLASRSSHDCVCPSGGFKKHSNRLDLADQATAVAYMNKHFEILSVMKRAMKV